MIIKFNVINDRNKRLWVIILTALTIAAILIGITMKIVLKENLSLDNLENSSTFKKERVFKATNYNTKYIATVISNKTTNKYEFEEEYKIDGEKENFKISTKNELGEKITYEIYDNNLKISAEGQISEYILSDYLVKKTNILSLSTFISLYNDIKESIKNTNEKLNTKIEVEAKEDTIVFKIIINGYDSLFTNYSDIIESGKKITKMELVVSNKDYTPLFYTIYDENDKAFVDIEYTLFDIK